MYQVIFHKFHFATIAGAILSLVWLKFGKPRAFNRLKKSKKKKCCTSTFDYSKSFDILNLIHIFYMILFQLIYTFMKGIEYMQSAWLSRIKTKICHMLRGLILDVKINVARFTTWNICKKNFSQIRWKLKELNDWYSLRNLVYMYFVIQ